MLFSNRDEYHSAPSGQQHYILALADSRIKLVHGQCYTFLLTRYIADYTYSFDPGNPYAAHKERRYPVAGYHIDAESIEPLDLGN